MFYLYNGIKLPDVGGVRTDKITYPNATMVGYTDGDKILLLSTAPLYKGRHGATIPAGASAIGYKVVGDAWEQYNTWEPSEYDSSYTAWGSNIWWASYDLLNEDGSVYLAASEPVPVGGEPIDQQSYLMGWRVGQLLQGMRGRVISGETDVIEAILEDGVLYIINAKAVQDDDILEVT
jgi:hypothetical protein